MYKTYKCPIEDEPLLKKIINEINKEKEKITSTVLSEGKMLIIITEKSGVLCG